MLSYKKTTRNILGYLIVTLNITGASHLTPTGEVTLGKKVYHDHCEVCHGIHGNGKTFAANALFPPPKNFTTTASKNKMSRERMIRSVSRGRPRTAMMPWENVLSKQEIYSVVDYIRQVLMKLQK